MARESKLAPMRGEIAALKLRCARLEYAVEYLLTFLQLRGEIDLSTPEEKVWAAEEKKLLLGDRRV